MKSHPYRLIGKRLEQALLSELESFAAVWSEAWLPDGVAAELVSLLPLTDYCQQEPDLSANPLVSWVDDNWCGIAPSADMLRLGFLLTGKEDSEPDPNTSSFLLMEVARSAMIELAQRMLSGSQTNYDSVPFFVTKKVLPEQVKQHGSGAIAVKVGIGSLSFDIFFSPATVERYLKSVEQPDEKQRPVLASFTQALGKQKVRAKVSLGSADLSLKELATIRVGDVVPLDKRCDEPASMSFNGNGGACEGFIGVRGSAMVFRVSRLKEQNS